ncbi:MAG TPA: hypothetical protein VHR66_26435 [Gemmataceae bacterium]|nr:hypothetical protein [Gemmataceae bacterium]
MRLQEARHIEDRHVKLAQHRIEIPANEAILGGGRHEVKVSVDVTPVS